MLRGGDESQERTFVMPSLKSSLKKRLRGLWADESGLSAVEYVLMLALIGSAIIVGADELGNAVAGKLNDTAVCIQTDGVTC